MDQKDKRFNWKLLLLLVLINLFCLFYKTDVLIVQIIKFILPFASCAFLGLQGRTRGMKPKDIAFSFIKIMLSMAIYIFTFYFLYITLMFIIPNTINGFFSRFTTKAAADYITSMVSLIILCTVMSSNKVLKNKIIDKIKNTDNPFYFSIKYFFETLYGLPKKTLIYIIYLLVTLVSQLLDLGIMVLNDTTAINFINTNKYTIVIIIALDRIVASWNKEKEKYLEFSANHPL